MGTRQVPPHRRVVGIDLAGVAANKNAFAIITGGDDPQLEAADLQPVAETPAEAERSLLELIDGLRPDLLAIDAPLTLPPCLTCPSYCRGPDPALCELQAAREMWAAGSNPLIRRPCETTAKQMVPGLNPQPTMGLGIITARAVALVRKLGVRGDPPASVPRGEILEVYPAATFLRLGTRNEKFRPKAKGEDDTEFRARAADGLTELGLGGVEEHREKIESSRDVLDAVIAAYTGWLSPEGVEPPPEGFNVASGWIWFPQEA